MTKSEAFLAQSKSDMRIFNLLLEEGAVEGCHILHYLQMCTEKLAKVIIFSKFGAMKMSHVALSKLPKILANRQFADRLGYERRFDQFQAYLKQIAPVCLPIEKSCPAVASLSENMPNTEYPWKDPTRDWIPPCIYEHAIVEDLRSDASMRRFMHFLQTLAERFEEIF